MKHILSIDIGTSSVRALLIDQKGALIGIEKNKLSAVYPYPDHIEMDAQEIYENVLEVVERVILTTNTPKEQILCIGICNSTETAIAWDKTTKKPLWNAIICSDRRSLKDCEKNKDKNAMIKEKTGLPLSPYTFATKISWILKNANIKNTNNCLFGTLNTWILWKLTDGAVFATDVSNASRTLLFNIEEKTWDQELLKLFGIKKQMLPEVKSSSEVYGFTDISVFGAKIPLCCMIGDAQSALFAAGCHTEGTIHCNIGSRASVVMNTGQSLIKGKDNLLTCIAYQRKDGPINYCLQTEIYSCGSVVEWLKSYTGIIRSAKEIEGLAYSVPDSLGVYFVPTLNGLSLPHKNQLIHGAILGICSNTNIGHICRALMEGLAFMIFDSFQDMCSGLNISKEKLKCSGGSSENIFLMQIVSDLTSKNLILSKELELSAFGAAYLAGLAMGVWKEEKEIKSLFQKEREFSPKLKKKDVEIMIKNWKKALNAVYLFSDINIA
jgi:glycerol kinase